MGKIFGFTVSAPKYWHALFVVRIISLPFFTLNGVTLTAILNDAQRQITKYAVYECDRMLPF